MDMDLEGKFRHVDEAVCVDVKKCLLRGPIALGDPRSFDGERTDDLIQLYCDPGGVRVLNVADMHMRDPRRRRG